ncbi:Type II secretion system protein D [Pandoraea aquatica]|uniref:Type II secretion system protein D n=1 Tax=Pandoraea aquatica TaxID=2508290 RepID=A0A5E4TJV8_9BURK|nr:secretin N-terminal domain-containing protein [Pandoraea aquatica]VVD88135.1 Type II secretion system protein D [Pandoraea aquatica]
MFKTYDRSIASTASTPVTPAKLTRLALLCLVPLLGACATPRALSDSEAAVGRGDLTGAVTLLSTRLLEDPESIELRTRYLSLRQQLTAQYLQRAGDAMTQGDDTQARHWLAQTRQLDPSNGMAAQMLDRLETQARLRDQLVDAQAKASVDPQAAIQIVSRVLRQLPDWKEATALASQLRDATDHKTTDNALSPAFHKPVSLNFKSRPLTEIFEMISQITGINFVLDRDIDASATSGLNATRTTAEDAINLLLATNRLEKQVLNANTLIVFPATAEKLGQYRSLTVQTFFLSYANVKQAAAQIKQILRPRDMYVDERLSAITVRDSAEAVDAVARLVELIDLPTSEVTLDVQVLEVINDGSLNLGIDYPSGVSLNLSDSVKDPSGGISLSNLGRLNADALTLDFAGPLARLNLLQKANKTQILANPRIRVRNHEKATISIGERVPVVSTTNANGVVTESVSYQDVGLKLDVEPSVSLNNEIVIKVALDVSNITNQLETKGGLIVYNLSARAAKTTLSARNNETQVLAGLINRHGQDKKAGIPGLSQIPFLGRLFGGESNDSTTTEVVLLITPRIERSLALPASRVSRFDSGTEQRPGEQLRLGNTTHMVISNGTSGAVPTTGGNRPGALPPPFAAPSRNWRPVPPPPPSLGTDARPASAHRPASASDSTTWAADAAKDHAPGAQTPPGARDDASPAVMGGKTFGPQPQGK